MIIPYHDKYREHVIKLILYVQNVEYQVGIRVEEQPDILDIQMNYINNGGNFWVALNDNEEVVGTIGLQKENNEVAVLKKFFVYKDYRGKEYGIGTDLYKELIEFAKKNGFSKIVLDTPAKATRSHSFYKKVGFMEIDKKDLPIQYDFSDRDSLIFELNLD
ncbi:GNAT family N-acetyltransferase [Rossellomorea sp. DA94]|uniref:GNAT family N-acetyltransferase n=1 Tax=Rossellomorea sp. DA94 TaxID=3038653 RepID=UPI00244C0A48|nr:GNAT family N-acetyltransferase [Rossellomorea sp. DA94]WGG44698.1 GNAT family N-acetyltransferase [Rossellomorea sp. DA94]